MGAIEIPGQRKLIPVGQLVPNSWNPNEMTEEEFNLLVEKIKQEGFLTDIHVVPYATDDGTEKFLIIDGEHRTKAAKLLGMKEVPAKVLVEEKFKDSDVLKCLTSAQNVLRGRPNPVKLKAIYSEFLGKYSRESINKMLGYAHQESLQKLVGDIRKKLPASMQSMFNDTKKEIKNVNDLSRVINELFTRHGSDLKYSFMVFTHGGRPHYWVQMTPELKKLMDEVALHCRDKGMTMPQMLEPWLREGLADMPAVSVSEDFDPTDESIEVEENGN
jgi:ParB/RepB/Spo0J family partition protein